MTHYQQSIQKYLDSHGYKGVQPRHVEAYMRLERRTLDALTEEAFDQLAQECIMTVILDEPLAEKLAQSYGL